VVFNKPDEAGPLYNIPIDERTTLIKRCQAVPGDLLTIVNSQVYINGKAMPNAPKAQTSYNVTTDGAELNPKLLEDMHITVRQQYSANAFEMIIPGHQLAAFKSIANIKSVSPVVQPAGMFDAEVFPHNDRFKWNIDNYGPLKMPAKGWTVPLNDSTLTLYSRAIEMYENNKLEVKGKGIFINGKKTDKYTFKMDYYWMMGDNRHDSLDSRFWGYVPEDHIIGKAKLTWFSTDPAKNMFNSIRWNRLMRHIE
jgi:signal peptidase I